MRMRPAHKRAVNAPSSDADSDQPKKNGAAEAPPEGGEKPAEGKAEGAKPEGKKQKAPKPQAAEKPAETKEEPKAE